MDPCEGLIIANEQNKEHKAPGNMRIKRTQTINMYNNEQGNTRDIYTQN